MVKPRSKSKGAKGRGLRAEAAGKKKRRGAQGRGAARPKRAAAGRAEAGPAFVVEQVPVGEVEFGKPEAGDRRYGREALAELGRSLAAGQLQSIGVHQGPAAGGEGPASTLSLIWGKRRLLAAREMKLRTVRARVYTGLTPEQLATLHATENLQRADWDPVEEAAVVADMIEAGEEAWCTAASRSRGTLRPEKLAAVTREAIVRVAQCLGKSVSWVSERAYLARLGGRARKLVKLGRLPLKHAIEIARLADPEERDKLAERAAGCEEREQPLPLRIVQELVQAQLQVLDPAKIPWRLELPVAGRVACTECPQNTANQAGLFSPAGHGGGGEKGQHGVCTNPACFAAKARLINREVKRTVEAAVAGVMRHQGIRKGEKAEAAVKAAVEATPEAVNVRVVRQQAAASVEVWKPKPTAEEKAELAGAQARHEQGESERKARQQAEHTLQAAQLARAEKLQRPLAEAFGKSPGLRSLLVLFTGTRTARNLAYGTEAEKSKARADVAVCMGHIGSGTWDGLIAIERRLEKSVEAIDHHDLVRCGLVEDVAKLIGFDGLGPAPTLEEFLPAENENAKSAKAAADAEAAA